MLAMLNATDVDPVDGYTLSLSQLLLPISYRASALAQMEVLRKAKTFQFKAICIPGPDNPSPGGTTNNNAVGLVPAFGQIEEQVQVDPGTYLYGWMFSGALTSTIANTSLFHILVTDACSETPLMSDYVRSVLYTNNPGNNIVRGPFLLAQPRLISDPGLINVEIYSGYSVDTYAQLVLFCSAPRAMPPADSFNGNTGWNPGAGMGPRY